MIEIYKDINSNFDFNGDIALTPSRCVLKLELNGICDIEGEHPFDDEGRWKHIKGGAIIACPTPYSDKQLFRIYHAPPNMTGVKFYARHIFFDLDDDTLLDVRPTNLNCEDALNKILEGTRYRGHSNISSINTSHYIRKSRLQAICSDDDNSLVNKYGGERLYDNFDVYIQDRIGSDKGVRAEFGYNLIEIEGGPNLDGVITSIIPVGYDGLMLDGSTPWVDSPLINKYDHVIRRTVDMGDIKVKESEVDKDGYNTIEEARQAMIDRCNELFKGGIDKPTVNYNVDMLDLSTTTAYENYIQLEKVSIGDTVTCIHGDLNIDLKARCISIEWDCITETPINLELGDYVSNFFNEQSDIQSRVDNILNKVIDSDGNVRAKEIKGFIDATKASIKAQKSIAQKQDVRAIECEDADPASPNHGSSIFGSMGLMVANTKDLNGEWDYTSALTARGLVANMLYGKILAGTGVYFDLEKGEVYFNKGKIEGSNSSFNLDTGEIKCSQPDGSEIIISPTQGFYNKFGNSKRGYHHLNFSKLIKFPADSLGGFSTVDVQLPAEFKGKTLQISTSVKRLVCDGGSVSNGALNAVDSFVEYNSSTNVAKVYGLLKVVNLDNKQLINMNQYLEVQLEIIA